MSNLLTLAATAAFLGRPEETLRRWVKEGTAPPSFKLGRRRMFRQEDVETWIREQMAKSA